MTDPRSLAESGILLVDKPAEWTSHDVVNCVRRRFNVRKVGHCGTLDPNATGLLVLVLGKATKLSERLSGQDKTYEGTMRLGVETSTQDREGDVTAVKDPSGVTRQALNDAFATFRGDILQLPPMVSAIKKDGRPLYKLARKGLEVEREPRPVTIHTLELLELRLPDVDFRVACSKGTYVRTLCADIGAKLGCGAHLYALRRLSSGRFDVKGSVTMETIKNWDREALLNNMIPLAQVFPYL
jgi:tRNA pseudouridine55 synthase